jgi:hypothetical protein
VKREKKKRNVRRYLPSKKHGVSGRRIHQTETEATGTVGAGTDTKTWLLVHSMK